MGEIRDMMRVAVEGLLKRLPDRTTVQVWSPDGRVGVSLHMDDGVHWEGVVVWTGKDGAHPRCEWLDPDELADMAKEVSDDGG